MKDNQEESRQRLAAQVEQLKQAEREGKRLPRESLYERRLGGLENVVTPGDMVGPMVERFKALAEEAEVFFKNLKEQIAMQDPVFCEDHEDVELPLDELRTNFQSWQAKTLNIVYGKCPKCDAVFSGSLVNEKWRKMGIPDKLLDCTFENFDQETPMQSKAFYKAELQTKQGCGFLILRGKVGTGKSHLAAGIMKRVGDGIFVTEADLVAELRETYATNSGQEKMVAKYRKPKVLVLDELTLEVKGVDIPQLLYRILGSRYNDNLLTVITSNEPLETIMSILGPRLTDRVKENHRVATLEGESYRKPLQ